MLSGILSAHLMAGAPTIIPNIPFGIGPAIETDFTMISIREKGRFDRQRSGNHREENA